MLEVFSPALRLMGANRVMESPLKSTWTSDAFIKVWYPQPRRRHSISGTLLPDHTSGRKQTNPGMIKCQKKRGQRILQLMNISLVKSWKSRISYDSHIRRSVVFMRN